MIYRLLIVSRTIIRTISNYCYDLRRYLKYSTTITLANNKKRLEARIIAHYHVIEKGLSLPEPRLGFGKPMIFSLMKLLRLYKRKKYSENNIQVQAALGVLQAYKAYHVANNYNIKDVERELNDLISETDNFLGGVISVNKNELIKAINRDFSSFVNNRFSIRDFSDEKVDINLIIDAIKLSQKTPSVCNRQSWKSYIIRDKNKQAIIQELQSGNRGFGDIVDTFLIVTTDITSFDGVKERYQPFIDGGMYAMSVIYSLHSMGLGTCALNWSVVKETDKRLRTELGISESEIVILVIAVGHLKPNFKVAKSTRKKVEDTYEIL